ncbi:MAG: hypothetical protein WBJ30_00835 [Tepidanaerobacteraceae bacterium]
MSVSNQYNVQPSYNVQTTVDEKHKLILDFKVTQNQMLKMLKNRRKPVLV